MLEASKTPKVPAPPLHPEAPITADDINLAITRNTEYIYIYIYTKIPIGLGVLKVMQDLHHQPYYYFLGSRTGMSEASLSFLVLQAHSLRV